MQVTLHGKILRKVKVLVLSLDRRISSCLGLTEHAMSKSINFKSFSSPVMYIVKIVVLYKAGDLLSATVSLVPEGAD